MKVCDFCKKSAVRTIKISYLLTDMNAEIKWQNAVLGFDVCKYHETLFIRCINDFKRKNKIPKEPKFPPDDVIKEGEPKPEKHKIETGDF